MPVLVLFNWNFDSYVFPGDRRTDDIGRRIVLIIHELYAIRT
jgi:hypothetical protein